MLRSKALPPVLKPENTPLRPDELDLGSSQQASNRTPASMDFAGWPGRMEARHVRPLWDHHLSKPSAIGAAGANDAYGAIHKSKSTFAAFSTGEE
jgi:hypothetical protein